jgi:cell division protein FtsZ
MKGARGVLINITGGTDMTLFEVDAAANRIREEVDNQDANIIFGSTFDPSLDGIIRVSVVATGIDSEHPVQNTIMNNGMQKIPSKVNNIITPTNINPTNVNVPGNSVADMIMLSKKDQSMPIQESPANISQHSSPIQESYVSNFDEYDLQPSQSQEQKTPLNQPHHYQNQSYQQNLDHSSSGSTKHKSSLFSRMWESIKGPDVDQSLRQSRKTQPHQTMVNDSADQQDPDVYEIPAFLRRNNSDPK